jgi:uncharacterized protein YprB with RNaseH-like and TPR domain/predicted nuclease with RNAse H fold
MLFSEESSDLLQKSREALASKDISFFVRTLPRCEHYRIALTYPSDTLFLDIETTGLSVVYDNITLVGWSVGAEYGVFYPGISDLELREKIASAKVIVTFNGTLFDLPFIRRFFPDIRLPAAHVDLRFFSRRARFGGPQKDVEARIGVVRDPDLKDLDGREAVVLWHRYCRGDLESLRRLIRYNHADIEGMKRIFDVGVASLAKLGDWPTHLPLYRFSEVPSRVRWSSGERYGSTVPVLPFRGKPGPAITYKQLTSSSQTAPIRIAAIDLTGSEDRPSGWALLDGSHVETAMIGSDAELLERIRATQPALVSIDSPLSLPRGRRSVGDDDPVRHEFGITRECERTLRKRGVSVYPCLIPSMQKLTSRGMQLAAAIRQRGTPVIESYPGAAQDILGIPRKRASLEFLTRGLEEFGLGGRWTTDKVRHDELDAITAALVGLFWWYGRFEALGNEDEGYLIIPSLSSDEIWGKRLAIGFSGHIGTGKTTAARYAAERVGLHYTRFSTVLAKLAETK